MTTPNKVSQIKEIYKTKKPSSYNVAELGMACGLYNKKSGMIFTVYPHLNNLVSAHSITYDSEKELYRIIKNSIDNIEKSEKENNLSSLPDCLDFLCPIKTGKGKCHIDNDCLAINVES